MKIINNITDSQLVADIASAMNIDIAKCNKKNYTFGESSPPEKIIDKSLVIIEPRIDAANTLLDIINYSKAVNTTQSILLITYLPFSRQHLGQNTLLDSTINIINSLGYKHVALIDVHDTKILDAINNSIEISHFDLFSAYTNNSNTILAPDKGSLRRSSFYAKSNFNIDSVQKTRIDGRIHYSGELKSLANPIAIIDDIIDSGKTIKYLLDFLKINKGNQLSLFITHSFINEENLAKLLSLPVEKIVFALTHIPNALLKSSKKVEFINVSGIIARKLLHIIERDL